MIETRAPNIRQDVELDLAWRRPQLPLVKIHRRPLVRQLGKFISVDSIPDGDDGFPHCHF